VTTPQESPSAAERWLDFIDPKHRTFHSYQGCRWEWSAEQQRWFNATAQREAQELAASAHRHTETVLADGARQQKIRDKTPYWADLKAKFPKLNVIENEDGTKTADMVHMTAEEKQALADLFDEAREVEIEKSEDLSARTESVTVGKGKRKRVVPIAKAEKVDRALHGAD
jgi:hypothetical protein